MVKEYCHSENSVNFGDENWDRWQNLNLCEKFLMVDEKEYICILNRGDHFPMGEKTGSRCKKRGIKK